MPTYTVVLRVEVEAASPQAAAKAFFGYVIDYPLEATERVQVVEGSAAPVTPMADGPAGADEEARRSEVFPGGEMDLGRASAAEPGSVSFASWTRSPAGELRAPR